MPATESARAALAELGRMDGPGHAWIAPERVRALAGDVPPGWNEDFAATVAYAAGKGWTDASGACEPTSSTTDTTRPPLHGRCRCSEAVSRALRRRTRAAPPLSNPAAPPG